MVTISETAPIPDDVVRELVAEYAAGETIEGLVARYPHSYRKIRTAMLDAGVTLRPPRILLPPIPPGMIERHNEGTSIRRLAFQFGRSYNQVRNMLLDADVQLRGRGNPDARTPPTAAERERREAEDRRYRNAAMLQAWQDGETITSISRRFRLSLNWVGMLLRDLGAQMPPIRKGVKRTDVDVDEVVEQYLIGGLTVRAIAAARDTSYGTIYRRLQEAGVEMRPRGVS